MEDFFEKKVKQFLPYIIIIGAVYLVLPAILMLLKNQIVLNQIVLLGVFPLTAFLCGAHYAYKKTNDFYLSLVAPIIYIPTMFLYGYIRDSVLNALIFLVSYFICGYIGLTIGEMFSNKSKSEDDNNKKNRSAHSSRQRVRVPKRVEPAVHENDVTDDLLVEDINLPEVYEESAGSESDSLESTSSDIDDILAEIRSRHD